ncbi:MAG: Cullin repeat-like-containing domain protein [Piptocephalis tieghemiana]|nr:MAG: Cullin repeat-like-containing domain protein [Piptocephalis tieghemiana]
MENLSNADEDALRSHYAELLSAKEEAVKRLQATVCQNYTEFIAISKEISKLETEVLSLRDVIAELRRTGDKILGRGSGKDADALSLLRAGRSSSSYVDRQDLETPEDGAEVFQGELRWLADITDELDVYIAHREFDDAVECIENARTALRSIKVRSNQVLRLEHNLEEQTSRLGTIITRDFKNPIITKTQLIQNIRWLLRLKLNEQARESFLSARSHIIRQRVSQLAYDADAMQYVRELSMVSFTLIRNTSEWYNTTFKDATLSSAFMKWVKGEIEQFAEAFRRKVFFEQQRFQLIAGALQCVMGQCKILREGGLQLDFLVESMFEKNILDAISIYERVCTDNHQVHELEEITVSVRTDAPEFSITLSTSKFFHALKEFEGDLSLLKSPSLYGKLVGTIGNLSEGYIRRVVQFVEDNVSLSDTHTFLLMSDARFICDSALPFLASQLSDLYNRPVTEFNGTRHRISGMSATLREVYSQRKGNSLLEVINLRSAQYTHEEQTESFGQPSTTVQQAIEHLHAITVEMRYWPVDRVDIMGRILTYIFVQLDKSGRWDEETAQGPAIAFGFAGVQQLVLDIHFFFKVCAAYITQTASSVANTICEQALRVYLSSHRENKAALKSSTWYDERVKKAMAKKEHVFARFGELDK